MRWMLEHGVLEDRTLLETAETIRDVNDALEMRQRPDAMKRRLKYLHALPKQGVATRS